MWVEKKVIGKGKRSVNLYNKEQGKQIKWNIHGAKLPPALATRVQKDIPRGEVICHVNPDIEGSEKTTKTEDEG